MLASKENVYSVREIDLALEGYRLLGNVSATTREEAITKATKKSNSTQKLDFLVEDIEENGTVIDCIKSVFVSGLGIEPKVPKRVRREVVSYLMKNTEEQKGFLMQNVYDNVVNNENDQHGNNLVPRNVSVETASLLYFYADQLGNIHGKKEESDTLKEKIDSLMNRGHSSVILLARNGKNFRRINKK